MKSAERLRATYEFKPVDHLCRREFGFWDETIDRWASEGGPADIDHHAELFGFDEPGRVMIGMLGWCEPAFVPQIETEILESTDEYNIVRDNAGRTVKVLKGKKIGFMPQYLKHAVENDKDWEEDISLRLSADTAQRWEKFDEQIAAAKKGAKNGMFITQTCIGGYMYLRAMVGPEGICYMFVDNPQLIHKMMQGWLTLADSVITRVQQHVELDELFLAEDICYNHGLLISPEMVRTFILPYYQQLLANVRSRQGKKIYFQIDTDGYVEEALELYVKGAGVDVMSPFEIAAGNDVIEIAGKYPDLVMTGGIDKRVLAAGPEAIDAYLERVMPFMVKRGGYVPTCDHSVPDNVSFANYMHYRKRMLELDH